MKKNSILLVVGIIAVGAVGYAIYKSITNARDAKDNK
jgi:preprotein translocase subunit Sss1